MLDPSLTVPFGVTKTYYYYLPAGSLATVLYKRWTSVATRARSHVNKKTVFYSLAALFSMIFSFSVYYTLNTVVGNPSAPVKQDSPETVVGGPSSMTWEYKMKSSVFGSDTIMDFVPEDALLYIEGFDYKEVTSLYLQDGKKDLDMINRSNMLLSDHFVVFLTKEEESYAWTGVFIPKDMGIVTSLLEGMDFDHIKFRIIDGKLIVTNVENVFTKVESARNKTSLNIALNPNFALAKGKLDKTGQLMVVFLDEGSKEVLKETTGISSSKTLQKMVDEVMKTGYNELVVIGN
jgi:hypothetical protein